MIALKANFLFHKTFLSNNSNEKNTVALIEIRTPDLLVWEGSGSNPTVGHIFHVLEIANFS